MFNMHHIITDGWSMEIIKNDFYALYEGHRRGKPVDLEPLPFRYRDFSAWHNRQLKDPLKRNASHRFWKTKLQQGIPEFTLPGNFPGDRENKKGTGYTCFIDKDITRSIKQLAEGHHTTLFTVMFSVYMILLSRLSGKQEVASSIIGAGRAHTSLHQIVGFFVNSIIYNTSVDFKEPFQDFLERVNREMLELFQHQDYPIETVFKELKMKYPDVPVSFNMLNMGDETVSQKIGVIRSGHIESKQDVKFSMEVYVEEHQDGISMIWAYKKSLFDPAAIESFVEEYLKLIDFFKDNFNKSYSEYRDKKKKRSFKRDG
jgi:hypothetical protein